MWRLYPTHPPTHTRTTRAHAHTYTRQLNGLAMVGVVFMVIELHLVFRGTGQVKIKTVPTELLKVPLHQQSFARKVTARGEGEGGGACALPGWTGRG